MATTQTKKTAAKREVACAAVKGYGLLLLLALALVGCGGNGNSQVGADNAQPKVEDPADDPADTPLSNCKVSGTAFSVAPADQARNIPPTRPIRIFLGSALLPAQLNNEATAVSLSDVTGQAVAVDVTLDKSHCLIKIQPREQLRGKTVYHLNVDLAQLTGSDADDIPSIDQQFVTMDMRFLGASFFNSEFTSIEQLTESDLLGVLRFGGRWVTELALPEKNPAIVVPDSYLAALDRFCNYATGRNQRSVVQIPVFMPSAGIRSALEYLQQREDQCNLLLFAIGNEVDRVDSSEEQYAESYTWPDYLAALQRIVPLIREYFPDNAITALDLSSFEEYNHYQALRDWVDPFCASDDPAVQEIDFISIHFYPYTGAQKLWDMLQMGQQFDESLQQLPRDCPALLLGEYNTTYQWRPDSTYPDSGGNAFIPLLTLPEILRHKKTIGLLHWSLIEGDTSTLGLFEPPGLAAKPVYPGYLLLQPIRNAMPVDSTSTLDALASSVFDDGTALHLYLGNHQPIWRRDITVGSNASNQVTIDQPGLPPMTVAALPPFSLNYFRIDPMSGISKQQQISYTNQNITDIPDPAATTRHCIPIADFSEPNKQGPDFVGPDYNQNLKIATGGTPLPVAFFPDQATVQLEEMASLLEVRCNAAANRQACGVSLPLIADTAETKYVDWSAASTTASFRVTVRNPDQTPIELKFQLGTHHPVKAADIETDLSVTLPVPASQTVALDIPWSTFEQPPTSNQQTLISALSQLAALRVMLAPPDNVGTFQIQQVEICDQRDQN